MDGACTAVVDIVVVVVDIVVVVVVLVMSSGNTMNTNTSPAVRGQLPNNAQQQPRLPGQFTNTAILANL